MTDSERLRKISDELCMDCGCEGTGKFLDELAKRIEDLECGHPGACAMIHADGTPGCTWCVSDECRDYEIGEARNYC